MDVKEEELEPVDSRMGDSMEEDNSDKDDETWDELDAESDNQIICLFCPQIFKTMVVALEHCKLEHNFNLIDMKVKFNMSCYSYISMINYIRKEGVVAEALTSSNKEVWLKECYLTPVYQDDPWLMFDFDGLESPSDMEPNCEFLITPLDLTDVKHENGLVTLPESCFSNLQQTLKYYADQLQIKENMLSAAAEQINEMRTVAERLVSSDLTVDEKDVGNKISSIKLADDYEYFRSYSHFDIHHKMLLDEVRTISFRDAIVMNSSLFNNKTVLDVGCGSGILSMFAASADAQKVFGVDQSDIIYHANDIIRENNMESKIELIHGKIEEIKLPVEKVDIIVSEWLGYFLLYEGMLDSVLYARDKYLKPDGHILPNRCCLFLAGVSDPENYKKVINFWSNVYGYKMSCLQKEVLKEAQTCEVRPETVATTSALVFDLNLFVHKSHETNFMSDFTLESEIDGELTALCGYFTCIFNLEHEVSFSTSPKHPKTHWQQTVFYLPKPIIVNKGMMIKGCIECRRKLEDHRSLVIEIQILDQRNVYVLE